MCHRYFTIILWVAVILLLGWLLFRFFLPVTLPFLLGGLVALAAEPGVRLLAKALPRWAATAIAVTLVFALGIGVLALLLGLLAQPLAQLRQALPQLEEAGRQALTLLRQRLASLPGILGKLGAWLTDHSSQGGQLTQSLLADLPAMAAALVGRLSSGLFGLVTAVISAYMISGRLPQLREILQSHLPQRWQSRGLPALRQMRSAIGGWLLAQLKLAAVTFCLLLAGLWLLKISDATMLAGLITLVDAFPVLGVGTVLLPWSLVCLLRQEPVTGLGLLALYAVIWLTRSVLEPRLVGKGLGLDPLLTLVTIYAGWRLFGIAGMLLAPIVTISALHIYRSLRP